MHNNFSRAEERIYFPLDHCSPAFLALGTGFMEDSFSTDGGWGGDGSGGNACDGVRWEVADEASLAHQPLTSCCVARFLTGCRLVAVCGPGLGDPCFRSFLSVKNISQ